MLSGGQDRRHQTQQIKSCHSLGNGWLHRDSRAASICAAVPAAGGVNAPGFMGLIQGIVCAKVAYRSGETMRPRWP